MVVVRILEFLPAYSYSMAFGSVASIASTKFDLNSFGWVPGNRFDDEMFYKDRDFYLSFFHMTISAPSPAYFMNRVYQSMIGATLIWLYLDHVISSNRGASYRFYFFLERKYWVRICGIDAKKARNNKKKAIGANINDILGNQKLVDSVENEMQRVIENEQNETYADGLRIIDIGKIYRKLPFGMESPKDVHAVKGIYLEVEKNELLCLLGHNGAGKSTLFNMMTGIIAPTSGMAKICGLDVREDQDQIRKLMGVVPQFDILWNQLSAAEHMRMFSKIKGVPNHLIEQECDDLLTQVDLLDVKDA